MKHVPIAKPIVLIFKETLLPISETFIEGQALQLTQFIPRYIGLGRVTPSLSVPQDSILLTHRRSAAARLRQKLYRRVGVAPMFHRRAARSGANLIHAHFASGGRSALPLARRLKIPLIVTLHGSDVTTRMDFAQRYRDLWEEASAFLCVSEFIKQKAAEAGFPKNKLQVHYIGIDGSALRPTSAAKRQNVVLFVGRLVEKKGCEFLLRAMAVIKKWHPQAQTVVIGDGPLRHSLENLAHRLAIPCQFLGAKPASVVGQWMASVRVFCAPSVTAASGDSEGLGMVFLEAEAMGTPAVSFNHGGIPEVVVENQTGLLAPERDCDQLALNIRRLLEDNDLWNSCSERGPTWVRDRFNLKSQTQVLEGIYAEICRSMGNANDLNFQQTKTIASVKQLVPTRNTSPCHDSV